MYAKKEGLLNQKGWKRCKRFAKNAKKLARMINQTKLRSYRSKPKYKYGYQVPRNHQEAVFIDKRMGNTKWQDAEKLEVSQLGEYETFRSKSKSVPVPSGYQKIRSQSRMQHLVIQPQ